MGKVKAKYLAMLHITQLAGIYWTSRVPRPELSAKRVTIVRVRWKRSTFQWYRNSYPAGFGEWMECSPAESPAELSRYFAKGEFFIESP